MHITQSRAERIAETSTFFNETGYTRLYAEAWVYEDDPEPKSVKIAVVEDVPNHPTQIGFMYLSPEAAREFLRQLTDVVDAVS